MNNRGMTFVELLFASMIVAFVSLVTVSVNGMALRMFHYARAEADLFSEGKYVLEMIQTGERTLYGLSKARSGTVALDADQKGLNFSVDKNAEYTQSTADDVPMRIALDTGDGDIATTADNSLFIDPDTGVGGDAFLVGGDIEDLTFTENGDVVTVDLTLAKTIRENTVRVEVTRDIWMRN